MRLGKKKFLMGILLVTGCLFLMTGCGRAEKTKAEEASKPNITVKEPEGMPGKETEEETGKAEEKEADKETDKGTGTDRKTEPGIELKGMTEEILLVLGTEEEKIETAVQKWTTENGYAGVSSVTFYDPMWIYFSEDKYSIDCHLTFDDGGNGIRPEDGGKRITMDYYKAKRRIQFHE